MSEAAFYGEGSTALSDVPLPPDNEGEEEESGGAATGQPKKSNTLPIWGNQKTMNMNTLIVENILMSHYYRIKLRDMKTYHEVLDEIYYHVNHCEPWEKGSRKTSGQVGMCGGVRGVAAGGIVSSCFTLIYKMFTIKLTRKQLRAMITSQDSPYIRAVGFMYIRFCQPPNTLWDWYEEFLDDDEEIDVKAGGGHVMMVGDMLQHFLTKLDWHATLFPRIPVPVQKQIEEKLKQRSVAKYGENGPPPPLVRGSRPVVEPKSTAQRDCDRPLSRDKEIASRDRDRPSSRDRDRYGGRDRGKDRDYYGGGDRKHDRDRGSKGYSRDRDRDRDRGYDRGRRSRSRSPRGRQRRSRSRDRDRDRSYRR